MSESMSDMRANCVNLMMAIVNRQLGWAAAGGRQQGGAGCCGRQRRAGRRYCDEGGRQGGARVARLLVYAGGKCELRAPGGGMALATGGLAVGGSRGG